MEAEMQKPAVFRLAGSLDALIQPAGIILISSISVNY